MSSINPEFYAPYNYTPDVKRARHNLSGKRSYTIQTGALVPVLTKRMYKGDDFKIRPMSLLQTIIPFERPLLDCFELRIETYLCPLSNYYGWMDNNSRESSEDIVQGSEKWRFQLIDGPDDSGDGSLSYDSYRSYLLNDNYGEGDTPEARYISRLKTNPYQIQKGSMFQHLGVPAGFSGSFNSGDESFVDTPFNTVNIESLLCYLDIVRCYHINTQYESVPFFGGRQRVLSSGSENFFSFPFTQQELDDLFVDLRYASRNVNARLYLSYNESPSVGLGNLSINALLSYLEFCHLQQGGFFPVQHRPDFMRNLLSIVNGELQASATPNEDGSINVHEMQDKSHLQSFYDALYLSGGRYSNRIRTSFGMKMHQNLHMPILLDVQRQLIDPSNITAVASSGDYDLGEKAANIDKFNTGGWIRVRPDLDSYLMVVASITPLPGYAQGFDHDITHLSFMDDFTPELQGMSFESIAKGYYSALPESFYGTESGQVTVQPVDCSLEVGKNVKWMHYRTDVNRVYGEFTPIFGEFDSMVLSRRYSNLGQTSTQGVDADLTTGLYFDLGPYVNPLEYNGVFNFNTLYDEPWSLHISFDIRAKRPILKRIKPSF